MNYYSLNQYLKDIYGQKIYKIAIDGGFTCPNRDGTIGTRGCIFCSGAGSGDFTSGRDKSISEQIALGKEKLENKIQNGKYIAYFQAFTNTYAPVEVLRKTFMAAMEHPDIVGISIGTRPDCLSEEVLQLLKELQQIKPVWVELGLQTIHEKTAKYIRRGYALSVYDEAVRNLKRIGIAHIVVHVIFGLPGETKEQMLETVRYVSKSGVDGIKLQLLHVIRGTDLEQDYRDGLFEALTLEEYTELVTQSIAMLPECMVIHRITGDGDKKTLVAPLWSTNKKHVLNTLNRAIQNCNRNDSI